MVKVSFNGVRDAVIGQLIGSVIVIVVVRLLFSEQQVMEVATGFVKFLYGG